MGERLCPGLPADWLNAWLAAIGALVLCPELRLRWTDDPVPLAVLCSDDDPVDRLVAAWPSTDDLEALPISRHLDGHPQLDPNPTVEAYADRAALARTHAQGWALSSLYTDLVWSNQQKTHVIGKGSFTAPAPGPVGTVHDRLLKVAEQADPDALGLALDGAAPRVGSFGLGFDITRLLSRADKSSTRVAPHVEVLAFFGLAIFPVRGDGLHSSHRGWVGKLARFRWWTWRDLLSLHGIDALLDASMSSGSWPGGLGITRAFETVSYVAPQPDQVLALGSRPAGGR